MTNMKLSSNKRKIAQLHGMVCKPTSRGTLHLTRQMRLLLLLNAGIEVFTSLRECAHQFVTTVSARLAGDASGWSRQRHLAGVHHFSTCDDANDLREEPQHRLSNSSVMKLFYNGDGEEYM